MAAMGVGEEEREKKVILIVCSKFFSFSCKISTWHVRIGGCKHGGLHSIRTEFNLFFFSINNTLLHVFNVLNEWAHFSWAYQF